jgi:hypothetical protein
MDQLNNVAEQLKNDLSAAMYTYLAGLHNQLETSTNIEIANDVVITVLSLNLGHIIGQLNPCSRKKNIKLVNEIIKDQITEVSKLTDIDSYGMIGHA